MSATTIIDCCETDSNKSKAKTDLQPMEVKAKFKIKDTFVITSRGLVLAGAIEDDGTIAPGDYIEFNAFGAMRKRRINGVSGIRKAADDSMNIGLLIECLNEVEIIELRKWRTVGELAIVTSQ